MPARAFQGMNTLGSPSGTLTPLVVSKAVSNLSIASDFYTNVLEAKHYMSTIGGDARASFYSFSQHGSASTLVRLVEHSPNKSHGMSVQDFEDGKLQAHRNAIHGAFCGFDRWCAVRFQYAPTSLNCPLESGLTTTTGPRVHTTRANRWTRCACTWTLIGQRIFHFQPHFIISGNSRHMTCMPSTRLEMRSSS